MLFAEKNFEKSAAVKKPRNFPPKNFKKFLQPQLIEAKKLKPGILEYRKFLEMQIQEKVEKKLKLKALEVQEAVAEKNRLNAELEILEAEKAELMRIENLEISKI